MLAQNFKSATELGLCEPELWALVKVLHMFEREEITYAEKAKSGAIDKSHLVGFNMWSFYGASECGTVACICGWAEHVGALEPFSLVEKRLKNKQLEELFEARDLPSRHDFSSITPSQAAVALRSFLTTGEARWREAICTT